jgi:hypothetical protein
LEAPLSLLCAMVVYYRAVCMYGNVPSDRRRCRSGVEAIFVRATWPEKPGFSGRIGISPSLPRMALRSMNDLHMPRKAENLPPRKEAPHSALTGADAARADVTGRRRRGAETLVVATVLSVIFLYALLAVGGAWG